MIQVLDYSWNPILPSSNKTAWTIYLAESIRSRTFVCNTWDAGILLRVSKNYVIVNLVDTYNPNKTSKRIQCVTTRQTQIRYGNKVSVFNGLKPTLWFFFCERN